MINSEQIQARAEQIIDDMKIKHGVNDFYAPVMLWGEFLSLLAERDADKALIAELAGALEDCVYRIDCTITKGEATLLDIETARKAHALLAGITLVVGE
ncbi:hypothetical protein C9415_10170 [Kluyvera sp. Nf5]|nr:hypothetical protein C9415_10170 [Kluyvera sp. Nf5]